MADITQGIKSTLTLLRPQLAPGVDIKRELAQLPKIECYASELNQCFMTLLVNASDALDGDGSITIKTSAGDDHVYIEISDTGRGIPAEKLANPFEITFSQKDSRMRMRVGLSNTYNIIKKHGRRYQSGEPDRPRDHLPHTPSDPTKGPQLVSCI